MKILIAEDEPVSRRLLASTLERLGHSVIAVANGLDATARLSEPDGPHAAILDWMMPGMDGLEVCRAVRQLPGFYAYLILLTSKHEREDLIAGLDAGADAFLTKPVDPIELRAHLRSGERILELQEGLLAAQEELRNEAMHDRLTGLWNRGRILDELDRDLARAVRSGEPLSLVMADIDHFKRVNDTHGHIVGDEVLRQTVRRMRSELREEDAFGRLGGEEFLLILPRCAAPEARDAAERLRLSVASRPIETGVKPLPVTVSLGVACTEDAGYDPVALTEAADQALYQAKRGGRNQIAVHVMNRNVA